MSAKKRLPPINKDVRNVQPLPQTPIVPSRRPNTSFNPTASMDMRTFNFDAAKHDASLQPIPADSIRQKLSEQLLASGHARSFVDFFALSHRPASDDSEPSLQDEAIMVKAVRILTKHEDALMENDIQAAVENRLALSQLLLDSGAEECLEHSLKALNESQTAEQKTMSLSHLGQVYEHLHHLDEARDAYKKQHEIATENSLRGRCGLSDASTSICRVCCSYVKKHLDENNQALSQVISDARLYSKDADATQSSATWLLLSKWFIVHGDVQECRKCLENVLAIDKADIPSSQKTQAQLQLSECYYEEAKYEECIECLQSLIKLNPDNGGQNGDQEDTIESSQIQAAMFLLGKAFAAKGSVSDAADWFAKAADAAFQSGDVNFAESVRARAGLCLARCQLPSIIKFMTSEDHDHCLQQTLKLKGHFL